MRLFSILLNRRVSPDTMGPVKRHLINAKNTLKDLPDTKQWLCGGFRSAAIAAELLKNKKIIAVPTDTIYGLAGLAQNDASIARLYEIKKRDENKPLAICLWHVNEIEQWADITDLPEDLTNSLLPGPTTLVLKRRKTLNPNLNPGVTNVGVRVPKSEFIRSVVKMVNQPIALTSANVSNKQSTLHPSEFEDLWPELDGIFYDKMGIGVVRKSWRKGSTVVDLSVKGEFKILRRGIGFKNTLKVLEESGLQRKYFENKINEMKNDESSEEEDSQEDSQVEARV